MKTILASLIAFSVLYSASAYSISVRGHGVQSCAKWTNDRKGELTVDTVANIAWVTGYLSGLNYSDAVLTDVLKDQNSKVLYSWIDNYCAQNPRKRIHHACNALINELDKWP